MTRNLRSLCNNLIAFDAFLHVFNIGVNNLVLLPIIRTYCPIIPLFACFLVETLFMFAYDASASMPLVIGVERLLNVLFPFWSLIFNK